MNLFKGLIVAALIAVAAAAPAAFAATYAYVNTAGEVRTTEAANPNAAIMAAPGIHRNSGVLLVDDVSDTVVVGDSVGL